MKHKTIQQLRDTLNKVLKRGRPKQLKKIQKAYHGKRLKMWWASYAQFENLQISELKEMEGVGNRMKGRHLTMQSITLFIESYSVRKTPVK